MNHKDTEASNDEGDAATSPRRETTGEEVTLPA